MTPSCQAAIPGFCRSALLRVAWVSLIGTLVAGRQLVDIAWLVGTLVAGRQLVDIAWLVGG
jgi:hypothetical protein